MDGNVDPAGIVLDLEWLHRVGVRGVQMFDGGMGTPQVVPELVRHGSPQWRGGGGLGTGAAQRVGVGVAVAPPPGWGAARGARGGPGGAVEKGGWGRAPG